MEDFLVDEIVDNRYSYTEKGVCYIPIDTIYNDENKCILFLTFANEKIELIKLFSDENIEIMNSIKYKIENIISFDEIYSLIEWKFKLSKSKIEDSEVDKGYFESLENNIKNKNLDIVSLINCVKEIGSKESYDSYM
ncbi:hypothetical protein [Clostridium akagii]|uniref:hypothetical protein n=1 Tax=Clostridium akagii TaxID=91623 RepID=UPI00047C8B94|nr:hypothetical protein [Clostridium akagii]